MKARKKRSLRTQPQIPEGEIHGCGEDVYRCEKGLVIHGNCPAQAEDGDGEFQVADFTGEFHVAPHAYPSANDTEQPKVNAASSRKGSTDTVSP
jgi:hypothetical protein